MVEFILSIFYFLVFCFIIGKTRFFSDSGIPGFWVYALFGLKVIVSIFLTAIYTHYYTDRETADIFKYFDDSRVLFDALKQNPGDYLKMIFGFSDQHLHDTYYAHMSHWTRPYSSDLFSDSHIIIRLNAFIRLFSFGHFQVHNVVFNFISFTGLVAIYKAFKPFLPGKERLLYLIIALTPSLLFWGSGLLKESLILFALGFFLLHFFRFSKASGYKSLLWMFGAASILLFTKFYLLVALFIPVIHYFISSKWNWKTGYSFLLSTFVFVVIVSILPYFHENLDIIRQIIIKQQTFSRFIAEVPASSGFHIPELENGFSLLIYAPNALLITIIRPYPWECSSSFMYLNVMENILFLAGIVLVLRYYAKPSRESKRLLWFLLTFSFSLLLLIGYTTPVFGAIVRYKIPALLFLFTALLVLLDLEKLKSKFHLLNKFLS
ncbi:MAG: hypothetical protein KDD41_08490 [Flavobacteriales bacterium]|nr:hypothetical protein [Flavobacteriales bacterium]